MTLIAISLQRDAGFRQDLAEPADRSVEVIGIHVEADMVTVYLEAVNMSRRDPQLLASRRDTRLTLRPGDGYETCVSGGQTRSIRPRSSCSQWRGRQLAYGLVGTSSSCETLRPLSSSEQWPFCWWQAHSCTFGTRELW